MGNSQKRVFLIVLDSMGIGELPDAWKWRDEGSNTLGAIRNHPAFCCPNLERMGLFHIEGVGGGRQPQARPDFVQGRRGSRPSGIAGLPKERILKARDLQGSVILERP